MTDSSEADLPPQSNGISDGLDDEERAKIRPVDIDADVKEMERRKRVDLIMSSRMFREELERIIETQLREGSGTSGLMQQISDMMGVNKQAGNAFKNSNCVVPINDIRGIEAMGYGKGEKILRCKLAAVYRLIDLYGWTQGTNPLVTARLNQDEEHFLVNPYGLLFHEVTASSLVKVGMQGNVIEQGTTNFSVNISAFSLHAAVHAARPDIKCIINVHTPSVVAVSALKHGLLPLSQESVVIGDVSTHTYLGGSLDPEEKDKLARNLGPNNKVLLLSNQGALCCGETIEEAFFNARNTVLACESQLKLIPAGIDNLVLLNDEIRKKIYDVAHRPPESSPRPDHPTILEGKVERKWRVGGVEFEALMRMLDNAGFRTGYIYRHPLVKSEPPKPKHNDVEVPPAVSSLGYLLEEEELYRQGLWRKLEGGRKGHDRSRWLNSPNVYQKVEILETGTPDPKKITKWVADGSPTHSSTPVRIDAALQFVPKGTNPKEFKQRQQQIKDYRRADKISAGPQSHILEGVTWEEARKMQDATVTQTGDQVVLMGAASKGIIQRGHQHNAMVYKSPYAKNPFDSVTDEELDEYKKVVEKKVKGEYDTDFSESEGLSSAQFKRDHLRSPTSATSETEEESRDEPQILRIETKQAPKPSQPEVVLSDVESSTTEQFLRAERGSVNSYKSVRVVSARRFETFYRTNNFAGLPKGSYLTPNPQHFHIVRHTDIAQPKRPLLINIPASHYFFNRFNGFNVNCDRQTITISIGGVRSVSLAVSLQAVTDFIYPFANALNLLNVPELNHQACQTSYVSEAKKPETQEDDTFEREILTKLKNNLIADLTESEPLSEYNFSGGIESMAEMPETIIEDSFNEVNSSVSSIDEGIGDLTKSSTSKKDLLEFDDNVQEIGHLIFDFIMDQGYENCDLIVLPEISDPQSVKFLSSLERLYSKLYGDDQSDEAKNEFRIKVSRFVLSLLENDDRINSSNDSLNSQTVSDKIFSISETLNAMMDRFFETIDKNENVYHSTPQIVNPYEVSYVDEITSFKKDESKKSGVETYWFSVGSPVKVVTPTIPRRIINVDDIPLKPPEDLWPEGDRSLSPILEEPVRNLSLDYYDAETGEDDFFAAGDGEKIDAVLNGCVDNYVSFEKPETNVVVCNSVSFFRTLTTNSSSYIQADSVIFNKSKTSLLQNGTACDDGDEGDWGGFEAAKF